MSTGFDKEIPGAETPSHEAHLHLDSTPGVQGSDGVVIAKAAGVVGAATLFSRVLGAVRDIAIASFFGTGMISDAFIAAFRIPNLLRRMFGEGSLSIVFVPAYTECLYQQGRTEADRLAGSAARFLAACLLTAALAGMAAAPLLVHILAPGFADSVEKFDLTVSLTRTMFPYIFFIGLVALCMALLNVLGHFAAPALAPVCLNVSMIAAIAVGSLWVDSQQELVYWLAVGVVVGGALQLGLQLPFLLKNRIFLWRPAPWWHPAFKQIGAMLAPVLCGAAVYQINNLVITILASMLHQGSISYLYYADRLLQFPLGIFGIAAATAALPTLARQAVMQRYDAMRHTFNEAIRLVLFVTLPAMAGLIVLREPIIAMLFQRGAFDLDSTRLTASALLYYSIGLWAFSAVRVVLNVFYALKDTRTPLKIALLTIAANLILGLALMGPMRHDGLALAFTLASMLNIGLLGFALRKRLGTIGGRSIALSALRSSVCAAGMAAGVWIAARWLLPHDPKAGVALLPGLLGCILIGAAMFGVLARILRMPELQTLMYIIRRRSPQA
ncbi:murein biosynthesis integral membrane protein MurJ [Desulfatitalea tepidiphila]|uniref:murein biosynthesis integral membrane protein MurJ n=1 Tax=Desulfatitalea tepidiphila TaxID=1185843 RepID=UPI0009F814DD|nr:murein biosynthesis integral membrane protein MurJ [Desulfatitalea tepidiphila]